MRIQLLVLKVKKIKLFHVFIKKKKRKFPYDHMFIRQTCKYAKSNKFIEVSYMCDVCLRPVAARRISIHCKGVQKGILNPNVLNTLNSEAIIVFFVYSFFLSIQRKIHINCKVQ